MIIIVVNISSGFFTLFRLRVDVQFLQVDGLAGITGNNQKKEVVGGEAYMVTVAPGPCWGDVGRNRAGV